MIKTVARQYYWSPATISKLFIDAKDHEGLIYWYKDCEEIEEQMKNPKK